MSVASNTRGMVPDPANAFRNGAIDFTKGALVLFMVLYHWLNYFIGVSGRYYDYLRFLTPSFIFLSGFMVSQIHLKRYNGPGSRLARRLTVRGVKLIGIFVFLNVLIDVFFPRSLHRYVGIRSNIHALCDSLVVADTVAGVGYKGASFSMLVPIAYLLILSAALISFTTRHRQIFLSVLLALITVRSALYLGGIRSSYVDLLMVGVFGVVVGFAGKDRVTLITRRPGALALLYLCYLAVITLWRVSFLLQVLSVFVTTALLYSVGSAVPNSASQRLIALLGKYSLLGYISQIAILQLLRRVGWFQLHGTCGLLTSFVLGLILTLLVVKITDIITRRSSTANSLYRLIFA